MESKKKMAAPKGTRQCASEIKRVLVEALIVVVAGAGVGLLANFLSPRGLSLTRDYFPPLRLNTGISPASPSGNGSMPSGPSVSSAGPTNEAGVALLRAKGLQSVSTAEAEQLFLDPLREQEVILFVDARDDRHFQEGHIPGAYPMDRYYPEKYLPVVLPACLRAGKVIVYCAGGTCEDSEFAALSLIEGGVPRERIYVFVEGMAGWVAQDRPVEIGVRNSGQPRTTAP